MFRHSERRYSILQGHVEYVMHTFELRQVQKWAFLLGFLRRKRVLAYCRNWLFNFRLLFASANCLEIV